MSLWSNADTVAAKPKFLAAGQVLSITFSGTGTGYTNGASFVIGAPPAGGVQAVATAVVTAGAVTGYTITNPGAGYTSAPTVTLAGGSGQTFVSTYQTLGKTTVGTATFPSQIIFLDSTEAQVPENRKKGLRLPGWTRYTEYVQNDGATRYKVENLIAMDRTAAQAGDAADDSIAVDVTGFVVTTQPTNQNTVGGAASFTTAATGATGFQWQVRQAAGGQYVNATGTINGVVYANGTTATLGITGAVAGSTGNRYRCQIVNTTTGTSTVTNAVTLTFVS